MFAQKCLKDNVITLYGEGTNAVNIVTEKDAISVLNLLKKEMIWRACNNLRFGIDRNHIIINSSGRQITRDEFIEQLRKELEEYV